MKHKLWLFQLPTVIIFTLAFWVTDQGIHGDLNNAWLRESAFPSLRAFSGWFTNKKFVWFRGIEAPRNKIIIVAVDDKALSLHGRWPWHRDVMAKLIDRIFKSNAKAVGLDMVFAESDQRVPEGLAEILKKNKFGILIDEAETDSQLTQVIEKYKDKLVLGWTAQDFCQPAYSDPKTCLSTDQPGKDLTPYGFTTGTFDQFTTASKKFDRMAVPMLSASADQVIFNFEAFTSVSAQGGFFNAWPDTDGYIRRMPLAFFVDGKPYPSLSLALARSGSGKKLQIELDANHRVSKLGFVGDPESIPVSPLGAMEINFRGPGFTFPYVSAADVLDSGPITIEQGDGRQPATQQTMDYFKDAYVLIGATALGVNDNRAFPFFHQIPGTEGHATILDNLLSMDMMTYGSQAQATIWILLLMTVGAFLLAYWAERLESRPAIAVFTAAMGLFALIDVKFLFTHQRTDWPTGFFYTEMAAVFVLTLAARYIVEERNKKFIRGAFAKYVAPAIVDSILKDPSKLTVGGEKRELTILFSDIRGFTTFSEGLDAPRLAKFLNDYLSIMTDIVFDHQGTLDKYIGDAVMAFWGAPLDQSKHAYNASLAAVQMQLALDKNRERFKRDYGVTVDIGIGLNSGPVNVGNMGSERIFEYTVIGDHVNLASRLEGLTKYYGAKVVTSRFTFDDILKSGDPLPPHRVLDNVKVKGKKTAIELIEILCADYSPQGLALFEEGRTLYQKAQWDAAISKFEQAIELFKSALGGEADYPSTLYIERCRDYKLAPPPQDWDGSWEMQSK